MSRNRTTQTSFIAKMALPPWLQISPSQFTQAAIAGGEQGYQAASEAGQLAQRGLLSAVQLAQEAAAKAAEIAVRREQINAELAANAARVSAARADNAAQNQIAAQNLELARLRQEQAAQQSAAELQASREMQTERIAGEKDIANIRANTAGQFAPTVIAKAIEERDSLPEGDPMRAVYDDFIKKSSAAGPALTVEAAVDPMSINPTKVRGTPEEVTQFISTNRPSATMPAAAASSAYKSAEEVRNDFYSGKLTREAAKKILQDQFGLK